MPAGRLKKICRRSWKTRDREADADLRRIKKEEKEARAELKELKQGKKAYPRELEEARFELRKPSA